MSVSHDDLHALNDHLVDDFVEDVREVFGSGVFSGGPTVQKFEEQLSRYVGIKHAIGVRSGADALAICLNALGIKAEDEVLVPVLAPAAVAAAVVRAGATPVFVDVRPETLTMDPDMAMASLSTSRTKAMVVIHNFGLAAEIDRIMTIARTYSVPVIEDATSAAGARYHGRRVGSFGNFGVFGFSPSSPLGSAAAGGAITTNDENFVEVFRQLRDLGRGATGSFDRLGYDANMSALDAAYLLRKMQELDDNNLDRVANAKRYSQMFEGTSVNTPPFREDNSHIYSHYVIQVPDRAALVEHLKEKGIETVLPYQRPLHLEPAFRFLEYKEGAFPVAEDACQRALSIPVQPGMKKSQIDAIANAIVDFFGVPA